MPKEPVSKRKPLLRLIHWMRRRASKKYRPILIYTILLLRLARAIFRLFDADDGAAATPLL